MQSETSCCGSGPTVAPTFSGSALEPAGGALESRCFCSRLQRHSPHFPLCWKLDDCGVQFSDNFSSYAPRCLPSQKIFCERRLPRPQRTLLSDPLYCILVFFFKFWSWYTYVIPRRWGNAAPCDGALLSSPLSLTRKMFWLRHFSKI